jgi:hypothetical protein
MNSLPSISTRIIMLTAISLFTSPVIADDSSPAVKSGEASAYSIARGGRLYDKWFKENKAGTPDIPNPAYPVMLRDENSIMFQSNLFA